MPKTYKYHPSKTPIVRRIRVEPGKAGSMFDEMIAFITGRTVKRIEVVAEVAGLERTRAKKMRRRVVAREHRLVIELTSPPVPVDKRRRGA